MMIASRFGLGWLVVGCVVWFAEDATVDERLFGRWNADAMEFGGEAAPAEAVERMRFTFTPEKLLIRGNHQDDREVECTYKVDSSKSPKELEFLPPELKKPILGIYRIQEDGKLQVVFRREGNTDERASGRPKAFETKGDKSLLMVTLVLEEAKK